MTQSIVWTRSLIPNNNKTSKHSNSGNMLGWGRWRRQPMPNTAGWNVGIILFFAFFRLIEVLLCLTSPGAPILFCRAFCWLKNEIIHCWWCARWHQDNSMEVCLLRNVAGFLCFAESIYRFLSFYIPLPFCQGVSPHCLPPVGRTKEGSRASS